MLLFFLLHMRSFFLFLSCCCVLSVVAAYCYCYVYCSPKKAAVSGTVIAAKRKVLARNKTKTSLWKVVMKWHQWDAKSDFFFKKFLYGILGQLAHMLWQLPVSELFMHKYKHSLCQLENKSPRDSSALTTECYSLLQGLHLPNGGLFTEWSITWKRPRSKRKKKKKVVLTQWL